MEKSDGSYWLAVWDDTRLSGPVTSTDIAVPPAPVTINLGFTADIAVFDPLTGTAVIQAANGVSNVTISLPDHPVLVEVLPVSGSTTAPPVEPPPGSMVSPSFTVPGGETVAAGQTIAVAGVQFDNSAAANAAGDVSLNVSSIVGNFSMTDDAGDVLTGSGTTSIFAQDTARAAQRRSRHPVLYRRCQCRSGPAEHHHQRSERQHLQRCGSGIRNGERRRHTAAVRTIDHHTRTRDRGRQSYVANIRRSGGR